MLAVMQVSKAHAMLDEARLLVERRVPPALAQRCEDIHAAGGLGPAPPGALPDVLPPAAGPTANTGLLSARMGGSQDRYLPDLPLSTRTHHVCLCFWVQGASGTRLILGAQERYLVLCTASSGMCFAERCATPLGQFSELFPSSCSSCF